VKLAALVMLLPAVALAQSAVRYNDPPPQPLTQLALVSRIDALVARIAKKERRAIPKPDTRLDFAASELLGAAAGDTAPPNELVQGALWVQGIVEPPPQLILTAMGPGGDEELLRAIANDLPKVLAEGRFTRVGVGLLTARGETRVLIALQESFVELDPIARAQPLGGNVLVRGKLHEGFERPEAFVTAPDGTVLNRVLVGGDRVRFGGTFRCGPQKGRYQIEVTGEDRFGATVVANFPVWCGVAAPATAEAAAPPRAGKDEAFSTAPAAEQTIWKLLNADRAHAGLPPLAWDAQLATVARAHSADMQAHGFFGHISPTTGSAADRAKKAGVDAMLILENVARAFTPGEAERGLMNSPGHRANILHREATRVGIGVVYDPASREILVTQLFSRPPEKAGTHTVDELRRGIVEVRRARKQRPVERDAALDNLAQSTARAMATAGMSTSEAGKRIDADLSAQGRWIGGRTVFAVVSSAQQAVDSLGNAVGDASITHVGVGVEAGKRKEGGSGLYVVIVLATAR
jgi:uncharacterized protein YkwD